MGYLRDDKQVASNQFAHRRSEPVQEVEKQWGFFRHTCTISHNSCKAFEIKFSQVSFFIVKIYI